MDRIHPVRPVGYCFELEIMITNKIERILMKWLWSGPIEGGITQSMIGMYLQDPYCFVLYYGRAGFGFAGKEKEVK